jgi:hypothetical protein
MMQIIASANSVYDIPWPQSFSAFLDVLKVFLVDFITITKTNCAKRLDYYQGLLLTLLLFKVGPLAPAVAPAPVCVCVGLCVYVVLARWFECVGYHCNTKGAGGNLDNPVQHTLAVPFGGNFLVVFCVVGRVEWD